MSLQYFIKEVHFLHAYKHQSSLQIDFNTLGIKASYRVVLLLLMAMIKYSQSNQSNKFSISLQQLKKRREFIFCMQTSINVSTNWHCRF